MSGGFAGKGAATWGALAYFYEGFDSDEAAVDAGDVVGQAAYFFVEALDVLGGEEDLPGGAHEVIGEAHWLFLWVELKMKFIQPVAGVGERAVCAFERIHEHDEG